MIDSHNSLFEKFLKKGMWLYLFSFIIGPIGYIIKIIVSGEITVGELGILYGIVSLITLLTAYNDLGMTESLKHFIPKFVTNKRYDKVKSILFYAFFVQIFTSLLIASFFFFGADFIANNYFKTTDAKEILKVFAFFFIGISIFQTLSNFFISVQDTFNQKIIDFIRLIFVLFSVLYIFFGDTSSLINYSYSWIIGLYIGTLFSIFIFYKKYYSKYLINEKIILDKKLIKEVSVYALYVFAGASAGTMLSQIDMQMIIYLLGTSEAGYYTVYLSIITIPFMIIGPIFGFLFPLFSQLHAEGNTKKIKQVKSIFQKNFLVIALAFNILFFVFAEIIAFIFFGENFIKSGVILKYSVLLLMFNFLFQINFNILAGIGKVKDRVKIILVAFIFNFVLNIILINNIGVYGAALATSFGWILIWLLTEFYLGEEYRVKFDYKFFFKNLIFMGLLGLFLYYFIVPLFLGLDRLSSFLYLATTGIIWFFIFGIVNYNNLKAFYFNLKK